MGFPTGPSGARAYSAIDGDCANHKTVTQNHNGGKIAAERSTLIFDRGNRSAGHSTLRFEFVSSGHDVRRELRR